ncbi:hypothetical protein EDM00_09080 [Ornithobacterium rhinotracheale]|nr:hypothetical protein [Ornithobacterium rhinotracheale]
MIKSVFFIPNLNIKFRLKYEKIVFSNAYYLAFDVFVGIMRLEKSNLMLIIQHFFVTLSFELKFYSKLKTINSDPIQYEKLQIHQP